MLIHRVAGEGANEVGLGAVGEWERLGQSIEGFGAHRTLRAMLLLLVALTGSRHKGSRSETLTCIQQPAVNETRR